MSFVLLAEVLHTVYRLLCLTSARQWLGSEDCPGIVGIWRVDFQFPEKRFQACHGFFSRKCSDFWRRCCVGISTLVDFPIILGYSYNWIERRLFLDSWNFRWKWMCSNGCEGRDMELMGWWTYNLGTIVMKGFSQSLWNSNIGLRSSFSNLKLHIETDLECFWAYHSWQNLYAYQFTAYT